MNTVDIDSFFKENLTPILGLELLGDLRKETHGSKTAEEKVTELAEKFGGSGPVTNVDYRTLCVESLLGNHFPLDGRIWLRRFPLPLWHGARGGKRKLYGQFFVSLS